VRVMNIRNPPSKKSRARYLTSTAEGRFFAVQVWMSKVAANGVLTGTRAPGDQYSAVLPVGL